MKTEALMTSRNTKNNKDVPEDEITDMTRTTAKLALMIAELRNKEEP
tara:strand:+ start:996 stop:1136 length:141 start_codon:yes stop_codon:yes gene_type:complete